MKKKKLVYIVSGIDKSLHFEWVAVCLHHEFQLSFILIGGHPTALGKFLADHNIEVITISYSVKRDLIGAWIKVFNVIGKIRPDIIHTHLWIANLIGLTTGWILRVPKRIYTRHHAWIHYKQYPSGLKWDKLSNSLATHIIAISKNIQRLLIDYDKARSEKVRLIYHGFLFAYFENVEPRRIDSLLNNHKIPRQRRPVIGVIARFTEWKGVQFIIPAFRKLLSEFPEAHLMLANARGDHEQHLNAMLSALPASSYTRIDFEYDLAALYRTFDVFVHVPVDADSEAFGQTYIEPLIVGIPCIFTLSGIAREFVKHEENALVVDFQNSEQIHSSMVRIISDAPLRNTLLQHGKKSVEGFTMDRYVSCLKPLYTE